MFTAFETDDGDPRMNEKSLADWKFEMDFS